MNDDWLIKCKLPLCLGHEGVGVVHSVQKLKDGHFLKFISNNYSGLLRWGQKLTISKLATALEFLG